MAQIAIQTAREIMPAPALREGKSPPPFFPIPNTKLPKIQNLKSKIQNPLPDHTQLPDKDDTFVQNFQEHPQSMLLTDSILAKLRKLHPDGQFIIGQDSGIYWRVPKPPEPLYKGSKAPDWFYVPNVPRLLNGKVRRSYVLWKEHVPPLIALEFVSGDGREERDKTPRRGKFWVYEQAIQIPYYGIYEVEKASIEMYHLVNGTYELMVPNERGHYEIPEMKVEVGIWKGIYQDLTLPWMRWWDKDGELIPTNEEAKEMERQRAEQERQAKELANQRAEQERQRAEQERQAKELAQQELARMKAKLRELGIDLPI